MNKLTIFKRYAIILSIFICLIFLVKGDIINDIGYEFLDNNSVVHIWNNATISDYYFDVDSGIQLTNHYEDYWTRNIFCIGYYNNDVWNKIVCADELNNFNKNIHSDNLSYVNATLWKDIEYGQYDMRFGVNYYLGLNDESLSITIYGKNIGVNIPFDIGFAWKITDVDIPLNPLKDSIYINNTNYKLNGTYDLMFKNMSIISIDDITNTTNIAYQFIPSFMIHDKGEHLNIKWNENLNYVVKMVGDGNQSSFYVAVLINAGLFYAGQEKSTVLYWVDAGESIADAQLSLALDETSGTVVIDDSVNGWDFTNVGADINIVGAFGDSTAYNFTGNDYLNYSSGNNFGNASFSVGVWILPDTVSDSNQNIAMNNDDAGVWSGWGLNIDDTAQVRFTGGGGADRGTTIIKADEWVCIVAEWTDNKVTTWVNGTIDLNNATTNSLNNGDLLIGTRRISTGFFKGTIDQFMYWDYLLSSAQVADYCGGVNPYDRDTTKPSITWEDPTPTPGSTTENSYVYLNTTITDEFTTSAFFDWNNSLIGYWSMEHYNTTGIFDNSSYDNFGQFYNISINDNTIGEFGDGFYFSGNKNQSYLDLSNYSSSVISDKMSLDLWVKPTAGQEYCFDGTWGNTGIAGSVSGAISTSTWSWQLRYGSANYCSLGFQLNTIAGGKWVTLGYNLSTEDWSHIAVTFNGTDLMMYVNGALNDTTNFAATTINTNPNNKLFIGSAGWGVSNTFYNGSVDELKIYNRVLSPEEVNASYNNTLYRLHNNFTYLNNENYIYKAYAIDTSGNLEITAERNVTVDVAPADTCTCPGLNNNWEIDMEDYCIISEHCGIGTGILNFTNAGNVTFDAIINASEFGYMYPSQSIYITANNGINIG